jgi:hypothetical protein
MKRAILTIVILIILCTSGISTSKILNLRNNAIKGSDSESSDHFIIEKTSQNNFLPVNNGIPDFVITKVVCWNDTLLNRTIVTGSILNVGDEYVTDGCLVGFFTCDDLTFINYTKAPFIDIESPGVWKPGETGFFLTALDIQIEKIVIWIDFLELIPEKDDTNNQLGCVVGPDIIVSGFVYNNKGDPIKDVQVIHWSIDLGTDRCGVYNMTNEQGYYIFSIPVRVPIEEPKTYDIYAKAQHTGYNDLTSQTPEASAGDSVVLDFHLVKKSKIVSFIPNLLDRLLDNFPLIKRYFE